MINTTKLRQAKQKSQQGGVEWMADVLPKELVSNV